MPNLQYHIVKDKGELEIIAATDTEVGKGWVPGEILHSCPDEESAKEKLKEEAAKLADQKEGEAKKTGKTSKTSKTGKASKASKARKARKARKASKAKKVKKAKG